MSEPTDAQLCEAVIEGLAGVIECRCGQYFRPDRQLPRNQAGYHCACGSVWFRDEDQIKLLGWDVKKWEKWRSEHP